MLRPLTKTDLSFYGFAESNETEINYNYPVVVDRILVSPGQSVKAGELLMNLSRRKSKDQLEDQDFKIAELRAEEAIWRQKLENELEELEVNYTSKISEIDGKIGRQQKELEFKKSLTDNLTTINPEKSDYSPIEEEIRKLENEKTNLQYNKAQKILSIEQELKIGNNPYRAQIRKIVAEKEFEESQKVLYIEVTAPTDGLIGNISCKEEEHVPSYNTLLTFYEPHSGIIKGFVHEDLTLEVRLGDRFLISSLKDDQINYEGTVTGLGSRIIEIPSRLRKMPDVKTFGREVLIEITKENIFLQKEKVGISFLAPGN